MEELARASQVQRSQSRLSGMKRADKAQDQLQLTRSDVHLGRSAVWGMVQSPSFCRKSRVVVGVESETLGLSLGSAAYWLCDHRMC